MEHRRIPETAAAVAITLRGSKSANDNDWAGLLYQEGNVYLSKGYSIHLVDRVGGGDSFGGALIHSLLNRSRGREKLLLPERQRVSGMMDVQARGC